MSSGARRRSQPLRIRLDVANLRLAGAELVLESRAWQRHGRWAQVEIVSGHPDVPELAQLCVRPRLNRGWPPTGLLFEIPLDDWQRLPCLEFRDPLPPQADSAAVDLAG